MTSISLSSIYRIVKDIDPEIRIGRGAQEDLRSVVEEYAAMISDLATGSARNANRRTILPQDIAIAKDQLLMGVEFQRSSSLHKRRDRSGC